MNLDGKVKRFLNVSSLHLTGRKDERPPACQASDLPVLPDIRLALRSNKPCVTRPVKPPSGYRPSLFSPESGSPFVWTSPSEPLTRTERNSFTLEETHQPDTRDWRAAFRTHNRPKWSHPQENRHAFKRYELRDSLAREFASEA